MGKKKGLAAIFSKPNKLAADGGSPSPQWPWPSCATTPPTVSFHRQHYDDDHRPCTTSHRNRAGDMYKTVNSVYYFDPAPAAADYSSSRFSSFIDAEDDGEAMDDGVASYSTTIASEEWSEAVIRSCLGRRTSTDRFFFDSGPPPATNSILAASRSPSPSPSPSPARLMVTSAAPLLLEPNTAPPAAADDLRERDSDDLDDDDEVPPVSAASPLVEESVAVALDSEDPYADFRASMEEMVAAHGLRDWPDLEELLAWYLRINGKRNHTLIIGAFVDLLVGLASRSGSGSSAATTTTTTTAMTTTTATSSRSSSSSSVAGDGATCSTSAATTVEVEEEQCSGAGSGTDLSYSPVPSSSDREDEEDALRIKLCMLDSC